MKAQVNAEAETNHAPVPRDVRLVSLILASMGIEDVEPAVLVQLLVFAHRTCDRAHLQDTPRRYFRMLSYMQTMPLRVKVEAIFPLMTCNSQSKAE